MLVPPFLCQLLTIWSLLLVWGPREVVAGGVVIKECGGGAGRPGLGTEPRASKTGVPHGSLMRAARPKSTSEGCVSILLAEVHIPSLTLLIS